MLKNTWNFGKKKFKIYNSTTSSLSKVPSKSSNSFSKLISLSIKSTKLKGDLQPILGSLAQFLLTKINLPNFFDCKQHFLRLVRISTNENILFVSIWDPTILKIYLAQKQIVGNMLSCFSHHCSGHLMSLISTW